MIMRMTGNTILITGGGSGIGLGLAKSFAEAGNKVIIAGRRKEALDAATAQNPGLQSMVLDIDSPKAIEEFSKRINQEHPELNVLINNAGIMRPEQAKSGNVADAEAMITTNLLGPIRLTAALLPQLLKNPNAAIMMVSSGLAFVPLAMTPTYCATKAAIHSYSQSLRYQLKDTGVQVLELAPPYVQTELMGPGQAADPRAMPLDEFINETMNILKSSPDAEEICVENVKPLRFAEKSGDYYAFFNTFNDAMAGGH
jgi:uncharacterized oxidoreductase